MLLKTLGLSPPARGVPGNPPGPGGPDRPASPAGGPAARRDPRHAAEAPADQRAVRRFVQAAAGESAPTRRGAGRVGNSHRRRGAQARGRARPARPDREGAAVHVQVRREEEARRRARRVVQQGHQEGRDGDPRAGLRRGAGKARGRNGDAQGARRAHRRRARARLAVRQAEAGSALCVPLRGRALPRSAVEVLQAQAARADGLQARRQEVRRHPCGLPVAGRQHHEPRSPPSSSTSASSTAATSRACSRWICPAPDEAGEYVLLIFRIAAEPQPVAHFTVGK